MLNRDEFADLVPDMELGEEVSGAMHTPEQGHVNPLRLLAAMRCAFLKNGGIFAGAQTVGEIVPKTDGSVSQVLSFSSYLLFLERPARIELAPLGWKPKTLPLDDGRFVLG